MRQRGVVFNENGRHKGDTSNLVILSGDCNKMRVSHFRRQGAKGMLWPAECADIQGAR